MLNLSANQQCYFNDSILDKHTFLTNSKEQLNLSLPKSSPLMSGSHWDSERLQEEIRINANNIGRLVSCFGIPGIGNGSSMSYGSRCK